MIEIRQNESKSKGFFVLKLGFAVCKLTFEMAKKWIERPQQTLSSFS